MKNKEIEEVLEHLSATQKINNGWTSFSDKECKVLFNYIKQLENRNKELYEGFMATQEELTDYATKNEQLENNRDKAIEVINTQLKNAEGGMKDNLRIIKFNLIKGSCTFEDLKTEEDYKFILKGDSDEFRNN